jgi:hypothetical protein
VRCDAEGTPFRRRSVAVRNAVRSSVEVEVEVEGEIEVP